MLKKLSTVQIQFLKNILLTTVLGSLIGLLNYLFNIFVARYTESDIFGIFSTSMGLIYLLQIPAISIQSLVTKEIAKNKEKDLHHYKWYSLITFTLIGIIFAIAFLLLRKEISDISSIPIGSVYFLCITLLISFVSPVVKGFLLGEERIVTVNILLLIETVLKFVIGGIAIYYGGVIWALILANSVPSLLTTIAIFPYIKFKSISKERVSINFRELILITFSFLLLTTPFSLDVILVNSDFRPEYSAISLLGKVVYFASVVTASVLLARLSNEEKREGQRYSLLISLILSISIGGILSIIYLLFPEFVIVYTVGDQYLHTGPYIGIFALGMSVFASVYMLAQYYISKGVYGYLWILFGSLLLQIFLFNVRNNSLNDVVTNQMLVYITMFVFTLGFFIFNLNHKDNAKKRD